MRVNVLQHATLVAGSAPVFMGLATLVTGSPWGQPLSCHHTASLGTQTQLHTVPSAASESLSGRKAGYSMFLMVCLVNTVQTNPTLQQ